MVGGRKRMDMPLVRGIVSILVAGVLLALTAGVQTILQPYLGTLSPYMLYVAAVLVAGLVSGPLCGGLVMLVGGLLGLRPFLGPDGGAQHGSILALMLFWGVSALVLTTANELRVQLRDAMARLSAALDRKGQNKIIS